MGHANRMSSRSGREVQGRFMSVAFGRRGNARAKKNRESLFRARGGVSNSREGFLDFAASSNPAAGDDAPKRKRHDRKRSEEVVGAGGSHQGTSKRTV